jgi:two-component sensor histidine kinase
VSNIDQRFSVAGVTMVPSPPAVHPPEKRRFGTRLIETLGKQLKGDVQLTYASTGFIYAFDVPIASVTSSAT